MGKFKQFFNKMAKKTSRVCGSSTAFMACIGVVLLWSTTGPFFDYSDTWQLIINTGTTIITFLMVFLIQNSQNRDAEAIQIKLDELIRCNEKAHNILLDLEALTIDELDRIKEKYNKLAQEARATLKESGIDVMYQDIDFEGDNFKDNQKDQ